MEFQWDPVKSQVNLRKHGISFEQAIAIWNSDHLEIEKLAYSEDGEVRSATLGEIRGKIYTAIWTVRNHKRRLISVRRARKNEEKIFFEKIQNRD